MQYETVNVVLSNQAVLEEYASRLLAEEASPDGAESEMISAERAKLAVPRVRGYLVTAAAFARATALLHDADTEVEGVVPMTAFLASLLELAESKWNLDSMGPYADAMIYAVNITSGFGGYDPMKPGVEEEGWSAALRIIGQAASYLYDQLTDPQFASRRIAA